MQENSPPYLLNKHVEGHMMVRNDSKIPQFTGGQGKAIQSIWLDTKAV